MASLSAMSALGLSADAITSLTNSAQTLGTALDQAFAKAVVQGKTFDATLKSVEKSLLSVLARASSQSLDSGFASLISNVSNAATAGAQSDTLIPFAEGGIVTTPTLFGGGRQALTGEAGPEAIMPLARAADGSLGLRGQSAPTVNITIHAQDVESFRRSEAQVAAAMTRALQRGRRAL